MAASYARSDDGLIHLVHPCMAEFTLCGNACDASSEEDGVDWTDVDPQRITCPHCLNAIREIKLVPARFVR